MATKWGLRGLIVVGMIGALSGCGDDGSKGGKAAAPESNAQEAAGKPAPLVVSAKDLSRAFQENEAKAKLAYDDKTLKVTGKVKDISLDFSGDPVVSLAGYGDAYGAGVSENGKISTVSVNGLAKETAAQINKGQTLTVICTKADEIMGGPQLSDCTVDKSGK